MPGLDLRPARSQTKSWVLLMGTVPGEHSQLLPNQGKVPSVLQIWPPGTWAAACDHQARLSGVYRNWLNKPLLCFKHGCENDLGDEIVQVCPQTSHLGWEVPVPSHSLVAFEEIHAVSLSEKTRLFCLVVT